jgi:hypothetical protein
MGIKPFTTAILRRLGFRSVLVGNGLLAGMAIAACAAFTAATAHAQVSAVLLLAGITRSMQFTGLNSLAFADIGAAHRSSSATLSSVTEQIAAVLGVAFGAIALSVAQKLGGEPSVTLRDFRVAFLAAGALAMAAAMAFRHLRADAGVEVSGHRTGRGGP